MVVLFVISISLILTGCITLIFNEIAYNTDVHYRGYVQCFNWSIIITCVGFFVFAIFGLVCLFKV